ncbi:MAG: hypothetical protein ACIARQ_16520, partial [Phycisphaerales bacterium JB061]
SIAAPDAAGWVTDFLNAAQRMIQNDAHINSSIPLQQCAATLEMMIVDNWVTGKYNPKKPRVKVDFVGDDPNQGIRDVDGTLRVRYKDGVPQEMTD